MALMEAAGFGGKAVLDGRWFTQYAAWLLGRRGSFTGYLLLCRP